jgi:DNA-binding GntR family transcriptional regulator
VSGQRPTPDPPGGSAATAASLPLLDSAIHSPDRLRLMTMLCALEEGDEITERRLQELLELDGEGVRAGLGQLAAAGYVASAERTHERISGTWVGSTRQGRAAFRAYVRALEAHLAAAAVPPSGQPG